MSVEVKAIEKEETGNISHSKRLLKILKGFFPKKLHTSFKRQTVNVGQSNIPTTTENNSASSGDRTICLSKNRNPRPKAAAPDATRKTYSEPTSRKTALQQGKEKNINEDKSISNSSYKELLRQISAFTNNASTGSSSCLTLFSPTNSTTDNTKAPIDNVTICIGDHCDENVSSNTDSVFSRSISGGSNSKRSRWIWNNSHSVNAFTRKAIYGSSETGNIESFRFYSKSKDVHDVDNVSRNSSSVCHGKEANQGEPGAEKVSQIPSSTTIGDTSPEPLNSRFPLLQDFHPHRTIGKGTFGQVKLVRHLLTGNPFALKVTARSPLNSSFVLRHALNEKMVLSQLNHPNIVKLYSAFSTVNHLYLLLEWIPGGDMFNFLRAHGPLSSKAAKFYIANVVLALEHLHSKNIIYRDLKPENLCLDRTGYIKLTDFGFAKQTSSKTFSMCGTPGYIAPEVIRGQGYDHMYDWWSLGVVLYEMAAGVPPFTSFTDDHQTYRNILKGQITFPKFFSPDLRSLLSGLLCLDPLQRLGSQRGSEDIKSAKWLSSVDWESMAQGKIAAPAKIRLRGSFDCSYFDSFSDDDDDDENDFQGQQTENESGLGIGFSNVF